MPRGQKNVTCPNASCATKGLPQSIHASKMVCPSCGSALPPKAAK